MTDFIREVDDEVRHDRLKRIFQGYWPVFLALAVLVLAGVGAWQAYDYLRSEKAQAAGGRYLDALNLARDGKTDEAATALRAIGQDDTGGYRALARMRLAAALGVKDGAAGARLFDEIAADASLDPAFRDVARTRSAMLLMDSAAYPDLKQRLEPLADANNPLRNTARELLALAALKADKTEEAGRLLEAIEADSTTGMQLRQFASLLQGLVRGAGLQPAGEAAAPAPDAAHPATPAPAEPAAK